MSAERVFDRMLRDQFDRVKQKERRAKSPQALLDKAIVAVSTPETRKADRLSTLSARVVEAAVERVQALRADGGNFLGLRHQRALTEECAAVDALIAERQR